MGKVRVHRMLRANCDCGPCQKKRAEWDAIQERKKSPPVVAESIRPAVSAAAPDRPPAQRPERLRCASCYKRMNRTRLNHSECCECRQPAPRIPQNRYTYVLCSGGCGKRMQRVSSSASEPMCRPCRKPRTVAALLSVPAVAIRPEDRTHCPHGHEYTRENTRLDSRGFRRCRTCESAYSRKYVIEGRRPKLRGHRAWRVLRDQYRKECAAVKSPCWICGESIDYALEWPDRMAFEADHILGVKNHPELALDPSNLAPSHSRCNKSRGALQTHADAAKREVFLLKQLELAQIEVAKLRQHLTEPTQLQLIG
jgi:hypothetical protein